MKKIFIIAFFFSCILSPQSFALTDTDSDGVADESDICPRVYARSINGCPTLADVKAPMYTLNACLEAQKKIGKTIVTLTPICDTKTKICPGISQVLGAQSCDPIFPVIFDTNGSVLVRGAVYILDFKK